MTAEQPDWGIHIFAAASILALMVLYNVGIWSRSVIFPAAAQSSTKAQLVAGIPAGLITMGLYGKTAIPGLDFGSAGLIYDGVVVAGNAIIFGMLSRDTLDKILGAARPPIATPAPGQG